jgi:hypothetical protein
MPDSNPGPTYAETLRERIEAALAERDRPGAVQAATSAVHDGSITIPSLYVDVLGPLLAGIGSAWGPLGERLRPGCKSAARAQYVAEIPTPRAFASYR